MEIDSWKTLQKNCGVDFLALKSKYSSFQDDRVESLEERNRKCILTDDQSFEVVHYGSLYQLKRDII